MQQEWGHPVVCAALSPWGSAGSQLGQAGLWHHRTPWDLGCTAVGLCCSTGAQGCTLRCSWMCRNLKLSFTCPWAVPPLCAVFVPSCAQQCCGRCEAAAGCSDHGGASTGLCSSQLHPCMHLALELCVWGRFWALTYRVGGSSQHTAPSVCSYGCNLQRAAPGHEIRDPTRCTGLCTCC